MDDEIKRPMVREGLLRPILKVVTLPQLDIKCQCAGVLANLAENMKNQPVMVAEQATQPLVHLGGVNHDEIQQDVSRAFANLASNEENHVLLYEQGALHCLIKLTESSDPITQRYSAMGLRSASSKTGC